jgi:hypothetical protein
LALKSPHRAVKFLHNVVDAICVALSIPVLWATQAGVKSSAKFLTAARSAKHGSKSIGLLWNEMPTPVDEDDERWP